MYIKNLTGVIPYEASMGFVRGSRLSTHAGIDKMTAGIMSYFQLHYDYANIDGKGYEPDIWCNPKDALANTIAMLEN